MHKFSQTAPNHSYNKMLKDNCLVNLVEWAIASHGMYESALVNFSILKHKNLYIVGCVQCYIWDITAYFIPELKYYHEK